MIEPVFVHLALLVARVASLAFQPRPDARLRVLVGSRRSLTSYSLGGVLGCSGWERQV
jgi:hypothetical protein